MPAIRRGSTYLDVSTTAHTPEGRLKLDKLHANRNLAYQNAVCTALLFICDENRDLDPADTLSVSFNAFQTTMRGRASAADMKMGSGKHPHLRRLLSFFWEHGQIDLTFAHNGRQRNVVQEIDIQPSFREMQSSLSPREKFRAYMPPATSWLQAGEPTRSLEARLEDQRGPAAVCPLCSGAKQRICASRKTLLPSSLSSRDCVVLITGTTGIVGAHLLECLLSASHITRTFLLNRAKPGTPTMLERREEIFQT
ncbi:hypothetical protein DEU56DRAFT_914156 [Suillus clintonianus]|uniref:uncharacterized protein n=1 Tax=Suillus clintonianus TaxID=1904413 RepID=UPI001B8691DE|nr:uncharacterized protein DEU56DRAFT_914156 [Suillus clintonianus]KAG2132345.1 hypothetical protein DEU56DRAFT_914156 [Suillus clintonianus]